MKKMSKQGRMRAQRAMVLLAVGKMAFGYGGAVMAAPIELANPDFHLRWDNTLRYNLGMRTEGQDRRIMNNPNYDESDGKFDKGDIVTNRISLNSILPTVKTGGHASAPPAGTTRRTTMTRCAVMLPGTRPATTTTTTALK